MATMLGTPGDDTLIDTTGNEVIVGFGGNDTVIGAGGDTVLEGSGNDQFVFGGSGGDIVYAGDGTDTVTLSRYSTGNRVILGFGTGDVVTASIGRDYIVAPGTDASISSMGGQHVIILGGQHDKVFELYGGYDAAGNHLTQNQAGFVDRIYAFNDSDRIVVEGDGRHPHWHQGPHGVLFVDGTVVANVVGHHLTAHDLIFV